MSGSMKELALGAALKQLSRNGITVTPAPVEASIETGKSKFGGKPDLPAGFAWPYYEGVDYSDVRANRPLAFLAQLNCADLQPYDTEGLLPQTGVLSFFYELETMPWGFDPADRGSARAFWFENEMLAPTDFPDDLMEEYRFGELSLDFSAGAMLPSYEEFDHLTQAGRSLIGMSMKKPAMNGNCMSRTRRISTRCSAMPCWCRASV